MEICGNVKIQSNINNCKMKFCLVGFLIFFTTFLNSSFSQDLSNADENRIRLFDEVLKKEDTVSRDSVKKSVLQLRIKPEILPEWFYYPPLADSGFVVAVGVSDPFVDSSLGRSQALMRGMAMISLITDANVNVVRDIYSVARNMQQNFDYEQKLEEYTRIYNHVDVNPEHVHIIDMHTTRYNETLMLLKYPLQRITHGDHTGVQATVFNMDLMIGGARESHGMIDLWIKQMKDTAMESSFYRYRNYEEQTEVLSRFKEQEITVPLDYYYYKAGGYKGKDIVNDAIRFRHGLWNSYVKGLFEGMISLSFEHSSKLKDMSDFYASEHNEELVRTAAKNRLSFEIDGISIIKKGITVELDYDEVLNKNRSLNQ